MEEKQRLHPDAKTGLTSQQVASQKEKGLEPRQRKKYQNPQDKLLKITFVLYLIYSI